MEPLNHFEEHSRKIRLTSAEKRRMRTMLAAHILANPVGVYSPYQSFVARVSPFGRAFAAAFLILLVGGGTSAYAAEGALPNEPLYSLKVSVVEPIRGALAVSVAAQASWQAKLAETRLSETEVLAAREELDATTSAKLGERVALSAKLAAQMIDSLSASDPKGAGQAAEALDATLARHKGSIALLAERDMSASAPVLRALNRSNDRTRASVHTKAALPAFAPAAALMKVKVAATTTASSSEESGITLERAAVDLEAAESYDSAVELFSRAHMIAAESRLNTEASSTDPVPAIHRSFPNGIDE